MQKKKGSGGTKKYGREARRPSHQRYNSTRRRERNKMKRVLQSCGEKFAWEWAQKNNCISYYKELTNV